MTASSRLLVVYYHESTLLVFGKLLGRRGYSVITSPDLSDAELRLATCPVDLMLCGITASDGDGAEFIVRMYKKFRVPSLAIAGSIESQSRAARLPAPIMRGIISMPPDIEAMFLAVSMALAGEKDRVGVCPDCRGLGTVVLLTSQRACLVCKGTGVRCRSLVPR